MIPITKMYAFEDIVSFDFDVLLVELEELEEISDLRLELVLVFICVLRLVFTVELEALDGTYNGESAASANLVSGRPIIGAVRDVAILDERILIICTSAFLYARNCDTP